MTDSSMILNFSNLNSKYALTFAMAIKVEAYLVLFIFDKLI